MIGILKALGARTSTIRHTFLWFSVFILGRGLLIGNVVGIGFVLLQQHTGLISLDPANYYVSTAPMELNWPLVVRNLAYQRGGTGGSQLSDCPYQSLQIHAL